MPKHNVSKLKAVQPYIRVCDTLYLYIYIYIYIYICFCFVFLGGGGCSQCKIRVKIRTLWWPVSCREPDGSWHCHPGIWTWVHLLTHKQAGNRLVTAIIGIKYNSKKLSLIRIIIITEIWHNHNVCIHYTQTFAVNILSKKIFFFFSKDPLIWGEDTFFSRFKVFICHIINYTGYNQKWNVKDTYNVTKDVYI